MLFWIIVSWLTIGAATGMWLVFDPRRGNRISLSLGDWLNGWATDLGWLVFFIIAGPVPALWLLAAFANHFIQRLRA